MSSWKRHFGPIAIATAGLAGCLVAAASASPGATTVLDLRRQQPIAGDAQAGKASSKICSACHGERGLGISPTFPNLAGQSITYLYVQLKTFKGGQRSDPVMAPMAAPLGDADMRNLAAYFASLPPKPRGRAGGASPGARLFSHGDPARGIPPCQGCHGPAGQGPTADAKAMMQAPWSTIPRLQGQSAMYVAKALHDFKSGARSGTSNAAIMHGVAGALSEPDIQSLAAYVEAP
jgi:cytochrome c553